MNILLLSNSVAGKYGYSVVSSKIAQGLQGEGRQVIYLGMQSLYPPHEDESGIIYCGIRYDPLVSDVLPDYLRIYDIDCLLTVIDTWKKNTEYIPEICKRKRIDWVCHLTANSEPLSPYISSQIKHASVIVCPSKSSYSMAVNAGFSNNLCYIPHGVDLNVYKPLRDKVKDGIKKNLKVKDKFVFLSVMRNKQNQKNFIDLFHAYKIFLKNVDGAVKNTVMLILTDPYEGLNLSFLREYMKLRDNIKFIWAKPTQGLETLEPTYEGDLEGFPHNAQCGFSSKYMNQLYNIADVHVMCSFGESFGLPTLESQACGIPQIAGLHTTGPELIVEGNSGLLANIRGTVPNSVLSDASLVDPYSLAECMERMYTDKKFRKECSKNALKHAKTYSWDKIIPKWKKLFKELEKPKPVDYRGKEIGV